MAVKYVLKYLVMPFRTIKKFFHESPCILRRLRDLATKVKTGGIVSVSGQYRPAGEKTEVTLVAGKCVPPVTTGATTFTLVDRTKHGEAADEVSRCTRQRAGGNVWHCYCKAPCAEQFIRGRLNGSSGAVYLGRCPSY